MLNGVGECRTHHIRPKNVIGLDLTVSSLVFNKEVQLKVPFWCRLGRGHIGNNLG